MILLKNGTYTKDPRLTRIPHFDDRSRMFPITAAIEATKPRSYTWSCSIVLDQGVEGACFLPGTLIRLADGSQKKIENIQLLDNVVTAEGRTGKVLQSMARMFTGNLVEFKVRGHHKIKCTPEHPILTRRGYVAAQDLVGSDLVCVTRYTANQSTCIELKSLVKHVKHRSTTKGSVNTGGVISEITEVPDLVELSPGLGRIIGLYAAEGCTTENKVVWCYGAHEEHTLVAETVNLLKSVLGIEARLQYRPNNSIHVVAYGKTWKQLFSILVPGTSKHGDKRLSSHVTSGPNEYLKAILYGWLDGDGHRRRKCHTGISVCPNLALDMHAIANGLGLLPTINTCVSPKNRHAKVRQDRWSIELPEGTGNLSDQDDTAVWRKVGSVELVPYEGYVYNLHVEGDESYVANGIGVHNCVGAAFTHELAAKPSVVRGVDMTFAREKVYWEAQKMDPWPGGAYPGATPAYEGSTVLAAAKVVQKMGYIKEYRWAFGMEDLIMAVGYKGPAVLGIDWHEGMCDVDPFGFVSATGAVVGGHAILCKGVNIRDEYFILHNSWGPAWGNKGECKISFDDMDYLLRKGGECCVPVTRMVSQVSFFKDVFDVFKGMFK